MRSYIFEGCRPVKAFKQTYPLTLPDGAQIFSEFKTVDLYMENLRLMAGVRRDSCKVDRRAVINRALQRELDKINPKKQPIFDRRRVNA